MVIQIPSAPQFVIDRLNQKGYEAYVVGGCVRDALLGKLADDWDICTNAIPSQILDCFPDVRTVPTGIAHGTVTVIVEGQPLEVTTFRIDGEYSDCRHPDGVSFTASLNEDLARRDFTVNAMAYHPCTGLVDLYGGVQDLQAKRIRCVGEAQRRFQEDALRILRGLRFSAVLGFALEENTLLAMKKQSGLLSFVAAERIYTELTKLLCGKNAGQVFAQSLDILSAVLPFVENTPDICFVLNGLPALPVLRYAALYRNNVNAEKAMQALRAPRAVIDAVDLLALSQCREVPLTLADARKMVWELGLEMTGYTMDLMDAFGADTTASRGFLLQIQKQRLCCSLKELAVTGDELHEAGFAKGKKMGLLLHGLLQAVMEEKIPNQKDALIAYAKRI